MNAERGEREGSAGAGLGCRACSSANRLQRWDQHQAGAVRTSHQEGPQDETQQAGLHPDPHSPPMAIERMPGGPGDEHDRRQTNQHGVLDDKSECNYGKQHCGNGGRMPHRDRNERQQHDPLASAL